MSAYDFVAKELVTGRDVPLSEFKGKVSLVVNVASRATDGGYKAMVAMYNSLSSAGLTVLAFPCHQFGGQELKSEPAIRTFVDKYGVKFPMFAPVDVNGPGAHPLFKLINPNSDVGWNFAGKWLIDKEGAVVKRYNGSASWSTIEADARALLA